MAQHRAHLVGLQATDEVPVERSEISQFGLFGGGLLQTALRETALAGGHSSPDLMRRLSLAHRKQPTTIWQGGPQVVQALLQGLG
jgi:hypothetical protein